MTNPAPTAPLLGQKPTLLLAAVKSALAAAEAAALAQAVRVSIAVVDDGGHLLGFARLDGIHLGTIEVAIAKARSAALFNRPTKALADGLAANGPALLTLPGALPLEGGIPIVIGSQTVGAIGVSGAAPEIDGRIAAAGIAAITPSASAPAVLE